MKTVFRTFHTAWKFFKYRVFKSDPYLDTFHAVFELASLFLTKDMVPYGLKFYVIYKFLWADCNASYVDENYRHISIRIHII